jgi:hypothetical protein
MDIESDDWIAVRVEYTDGTTLVFIDFDTAGRADSEEFQLRLRLWSARI